MNLITFLVCTYSVEEEEWNSLLFMFPKQGHNHCPQIYFLQPFGNYQ